VHSSHIDCALEDITRFLYTWHWHQRTLGMQSVWNGPTYSVDYAGAPYDLSRIGNKAHRRSRLYPD
jgi:hypothetical protein